MIETLMGHSPCSSKSAKICVQFIRQQSMYMTSLYIYTNIMPLEVESAKPVKILIQLSY